MLLNEGGNIFKDENAKPVTGRINQAHLDPTLQYVQNQCAMFNNVICVKWIPVIL